ncbi:MAG: hypothetical protein KJ749_12095 [Planctomycetes bacterium]|nr:hypothetical protein [Planctomycetota bacterium]
MKLATVLAALLSVVAPGCGSLSDVQFANRLVGADGQLILLDELQEIADNSELSDDEKRELFRELGIQDEKLIEALLDL